MCSDCPDCPECDLDFLHVEQLDQLHTAAVTAQNAVNQLPSQDRFKIMTELFGAFDFDQLDRRQFRDRQGNSF